MDVFFRRTKKLQADTKEVYLLGKLKFVVLELKIYNGEEEISLTQKESDLVRFFCSTRK